MKKIDVIYFKSITSTIALHKEIQSLKIEKYFCKIDFITTEIFITQQTKMNARVIEILNHTLAMEFYETYDLTPDEVTLLKPYQNLFQDDNYFIIIDIQGDSDYCLMKFPKN